MASAQEIRDLISQTTTGSVQIEGLRLEQAAQLQRFLA
jgi:hypothetical protein